MLTTEALGFEGTHLRFERAFTRAFANQERVSVVRVRVHCVRGTGEVTRAITHGIAAALSHDVKSLWCRTGPDGRGRHHE